MTALGIDIDLATDYALDHEPKCELMCTEDGCSRTAVAIEKTCEGPFLMCEPTTEFVMEHLLRGTAQCAACLKPLAACWSVIPL